MNAAAAQDAQPLVGIIMGSQSDWATLENTANMLKQLGVPFEAEVVSAHRTPSLLKARAEAWENAHFGGTTCTWKLSAPHFARGSQRRSFAHDRGS